MLKLQIPKNRMNALIEWFRDSSDPGRLERGWDHYHKGRLAGIELRHGVEVHALVRDTRAAEVILQLDRIERSECSCRDEGPCEHIAALLFSLYASFSRPELLLLQLKQAMLIKQRQRESRATAIKSEKKSDRLDPPSVLAPPSMWQKYFDQQFYGFSMSQQHSVETFYSAAKDTLLPVAKDWAPPLKELYGLHVLLFALRKIGHFYEESKTSYMSYFIETGARTTGRQCLDDFLAMLSELDVDELAANHPSYWKETLDMISDMALSGAETPIAWLNVYRSVWGRMGAYSDWLEKEKNRLALLLEQTDALPRRRDALLAASAHFAVMRGDDDAARRMLDGLHKREARDFFQYLHRSYQTGQWDRMLAWLRWLLPSVQRAHQEELRQFCQYWAEAVQHQQDDTEWVEVMKALLPRTFSFYTAYLLKAHRYRAWVDLQLSGRVSPLELYALDVKAVEKHDPALMLPVYHQAVERSIAEKNRTAYKTAMRLLKKLHSLYQKTGKADAWEEYIHRLALKHSRLRALQEELRKGKWIP